MVPKRKKNVWSTSKVARAQEYYISDTYSSFSREISDTSCQIIQVRPSRKADRWRAVPDTVPSTYASTKSI